MNYFPMFMNIKDREVLICGGEKHAAEKIERLMPFGAKIRVISENISPKIEAIYGITIEKHRLLKEDLDTFPVFVVAAESESENERIAALCKEKHIPINAVDQPKDCDFFFPSMITTEHLCVGVSTGGVSPTGAIALKNAFSEIIPDSIDEILLWVKSVKEALKNRLTDKNEINKILRLAMAEALKNERVLTKAELENIIASETNLEMGL